MILLDIQRTRTSLSTINRDNSQEPITIPVDVYVLTAMCKMLVTDNKTVRRTQLLNLQSFINIINPEIYINDQTKSKLVSFIRKGLEARLDFNLTDPYAIMLHINGGMLDDSIVDINNFQGLDGSEVKWLNHMISESLQYSHIYHSVDRMIDICTRFKTETYGNKSGIVNEFEAEINNVQNNFRKSRNQHHTEVMFSLMDGQFEDAVYDTYNQLASPRRKLITGMQGLNDLCGGGFEAGRVYVFFGLPGEGKSTTLLNICYQIKKYNVDYKPKDPTKIPCILLITMENTIQESVERLFGVATGRNNNMIDFQADDVIRMMKEEGGLFINSASPINIIIKFVPTNSVDTSYLYTINDDLADMGFEVICVVQDYIGRIRSTQKFSDSRLEYGAVTDEFKTFAETEDIPVISASQLNRDASKHIDEGRKNNKQDLVRFLGRSNISESMLILNNIDGGFVIAPEITPEGLRYLGIQRIKLRYKAGEMEYVYLPYKPNSIAFEEDFGIVPKYKQTLRSEGFGTYDIRQSQYQTNVIRDMDQVASGDDINIGNLFKHATAISGNINDLELAYKQDTVKEFYYPVIFDK